MTTCCVTFFYIFFLPLWCIRWKRNIKSEVFYEWIYSVNGINKNITAGWCGGCDYNSVGDKLIKTLFLFFLFYSVTCSSSLICQKPEMMMVNNLSLYCKYIITITIGDGVIYGISS